MLTDSWSSSLETVMTPMTVPAWGSFATGKRSGKHGCYDFVVPDGSLTDLRPVSGNDLTADTFYKVLAEEDQNVALINLPTTCPSRLSGDDGNIVITRGDNFVNPSELVDEISALEDYKLSPTKAEKSEREYLNHIRDLESTRFDCGRQIYDRKEWDLFLSYQWNRLDST
ncbi:alkaline phosphatase family protein [Halomicroarcula sp. F28]|uniref:Alkaline phosphatase family protein n=1 Tax=Haloarcula salinisoli TaxID=2487746 RepID=A0A8J8C8Z0_9EURY|nr:alkaline phosphatase family protein [Halomicroarcula salinisoli]MBX0304767.1 alkaline phosphatase family protein [Halomicroarcula salinisoli]